ncbi:MAG: hypothetical protein ACSHXA_07600 [Polaribacter sp.]|jgi:hypothetical protein|uniref:hypothetical protein n=1 Tax=Polaribacter sp. TaxID=1920175 RepID=UPI003EF39D18
MKNPIKQIILFFKNLYKNYKFNKLNKKLGAVAKKKVDERLQLRYEVTKYIRSFAKLDKDNKSKFIPLDFKTKELIRFNVEEKFGQDMSKLNVRLNKKLQVI